MTTHMNNSQIVNEKAHTSTGGARRCYRNLPTGISIGFDSMLKGLLTRNVTVCCTTSCFRTDQSSLCINPPRLNPSLWSKKEATIIKGKTESQSTPTTQTKQTNPESELCRIPVFKNHNISHHDNKDFGLWGLLLEKNLAWKPWHTFRHNRKMDSQIL